MLEVRNLSERGPSWDENTGGDDGWCEFDVNLVCDCCGKTVDELFFKNRKSDLMCTECFFNDFMSEGTHSKGFVKMTDKDGKIFYRDLNSYDDDYYIEDVEELADKLDMDYMTENFLDDDLVSEAVERARENEYDC